MTTTARGDMAGVDTVVDEWRSFDERHPETAHLGVGGLTWGFMRAIAECPNCPGVFRVPSDETWEYLTSPKCRNTWRWQAPEVEPSKAKRKRGRA